VQDTDGFPGNYATLPPPLMMRADAVEMIGDWLVQRLRCVLPERSVTLHIPST